MGSRVYLSMAEDRHIAWKLTGIVATLVIVLTLPIYQVRHKRSLSSPKNVQDRADAGFVGSEACRDCHRPEYDKWSGSHHRRAMAPATEKTVLGDFDDAVFTRFGKTSRFYRRSMRKLSHARPLLHGHRLPA